MGMEIPAAVRQEVGNTRALSSRPGILLVGPQDVGKRSILTKLTNGAVGNSSSSGVSCHGWTIDTKYYTADVSVWLGRVDEEQAKDGSGMHALSGHCEALVMVFDLSDASSFETIQTWFRGAEVYAFEVLLCVGNKADCLPDHYAHVEYRRRVQKRGESSSDPHPEYMDFGLERAEGRGLLAEEEDEVSEQRRRFCIEWCAEKGIEYLEVCAIDEAFDQCISVDGDAQGIARLRGALSAHMWPGMVMKPLAKLRGTTQPSNETNKEEEASDDNDSEYSIEYELLSNSWAEEEAWELNEGSPDKTSAMDPESTASAGSAATQPAQPGIQEEPNNHQGSSASATTPPSSSSLIMDDNIMPSSPACTGGELGIADLEKLMREMVSLRQGMQGMSDAHRRDMAANLATRMASMFGEDDDEEDHQF